MTTSALSIAFPYAGDQIGGSVYSSLLLARTLAGRGHRIHAFIHGPGPVLAEARKAGIEIVELPPLSGVASLSRPHRFRVEQLLAYRDAAGALARHRPDIVHVNDLNMLRSWSLPSLVRSTKFVVHWRSSYVKSWSVDAGLRLAGRVISVSQYSKDMLPDWARAKTEVVYNPFSLFFDEIQRQNARKSLRERLSLPPNAAILGIFGSHTIRKRTHVLADILKAMDRTNDGRPIYGLACGDRVEPFDTEIARKIADYGLETRLLLPGFVRPIEDWMAGCDLVLAPAVLEPLARNILEAQGLGVSTLVSLDGGLREWVEDGVTGDLLDPHDIRAWIDKTRQRLDDPGRSAGMAQQAQQRMRLLTADRHTEQVERIYDGVLRRSHDAHVASARR